ncbi:MAG: phytanoyl-CoA dioxygenase family protein [Verrucomicrobia bacterium]|nr:phytanoyl-CoA dioxygenase family protein [Verrucomicrobiota bacterium]
MLSPQQLKFYRAQGYLAVEAVFSPAEVRELQEVTDQFVERSRAVTENDAVFDLEPSHTAQAPRLRRLKAPSKQHPAYHRALTHPKVLAIVSQLIGPDLACNGDKLNLKLADVGSPVEWHQDWAFYPHTNDDLLAVGVAIDDSTAENGCLMVLPGTHRGPMLEHHQDGRFIGAVTDPAFKPDGAVPVLLRAGGISVHHVRLLHGSAPNRSNQPRRLLLFQYCAADAWPLLPGAKPWDTYVASMVQGSPCRVPRLAPVPVRLPLPEARFGGSIYENQRGLKNTLYGT